MSGSGVLWNFVYSLARARIAQLVEHHIRIERSDYVEALGSNPSASSFLRTFFALVPVVLVTNLRRNSYVQSTQNESRTPPYGT